MMWDVGILGTSEPLNLLRLELMHMGMTSAQAMRAMVESVGLTHKQIEARAGQYGGWVGQALARTRPGADLLAEIAHACGYRLALVPMDGGDAIPIGDASTDANASNATIAQTRALLTRALANLDVLEMDE